MYVCMWMSKFFSTKYRKLNTCDITQNIYDEGKEGGGSIRAISILTKRERFSIIKVSNLSDGKLVGKFTEI